MRISSLEDDPGYGQFVAANANNKIALVFLNGVEQDHCDIADEDQGFVQRCVLDKDGNIQVDPIDKNKVWVERVTGKVEVKFVDNKS